MENVKIFELKNGWKLAVYPDKGEYEVYKGEGEFFVQTNRNRKFPVTVQEPEIFCPGPQEGQRVVGVISPFSGIRRSFSSLYLFGWGTEEEKSRRKGGKPHIEDGVLYWGEEILGRVAFYLLPDKNRGDGLVAVVVPMDISININIKGVGGGPVIFELEDVADLLLRGILSLAAAEQFWPQSPF